MTHKWPKPAHLPPAKGGLRGVTAAALLAALALATPAHADPPASTMVDFSPPPQWTRHTIHAGARGYCTRGDGQPFLSPRQYLPAVDPAPFPPP